MVDLPSNRAEDIPETPITLFEDTVDLPVQLASTHSDPDHLDPGLRPYESDEDYFNRWLLHARQSGATVWCRAISLTNEYDNTIPPEQLLILIPKDPIRHAFGKDNIHFPMNLTEYLKRNSKMEVVGEYIITEHDPHKLEYAGMGYVREVAAAETESHKS